MQAWAWDSLMASSCHGPLSHRSKLLQTHMVCLSGKWPLLACQTTPSQNRLRQMRYASVCSSSSENLVCRLNPDLLSIEQELITAKACYSSDKVHENTRVTPRMGAGTGAAPGQAPPDLPSLLLDGRICYIGMPVSLCICSKQLCFLVCCQLYVFCL